MAVDVPEEWVLGILLASAVATLGATVRRFFKRGKYGLPGRSSNDETGPGLPVKILALIKPGDLDGHEDVYKVIHKAVLNGEEYVDLKLLTPRDQAAVLALFHHLRQSE